MPRQGPSRRLRAPWRRGAWSFSAEVALALHAQRAELLRTIRTRGDARGVAETILEEVVSDAICVVVIMRRRTKVYSQLSRNDAATLDREGRPELSAHDLAHLPVHTAAVRL